MKRREYEYAKLFIHGSNDSDSRSNRISLPGNIAVPLGEKVQQVSKYYQDNSRIFTAFK
jgi:hypothetical protein